MKALMISMLLVASFNIRAEALSEVNSEVFEVQGTSAELTTKAKACMGRHLSWEGAGNMFDSIEDGRIIANAYSKESHGFVTMSLRSKFIFKAKDGRFKIEQSALERNIDGTWYPIYKGWGTGWKACDAAYQAMAARVSDCIQNDEAEEEEW